MNEQLSKVELAAVAEVLRNIDVVGNRLTATPISGGRSNLTFRLDDGVSRWVLRTPPRHGRTPSAHDVAREHRVTSALADTGVPVARPLVLCEDVRVIGAPFTVAEYVEGRTLQSSRDLDGIDDAQLERLTSDLVATLAALHRVDHLEVGLEEFGRPDHYAERQLNRWAGQWDIVGTDEASDLAEELRNGLVDALPRQRSISIVHGDFRIDNAILGPAHEPDVAAVVDWELSTIGDPVADVAMMCAYRHPALDLMLGAPSAWTSPRLPDADGLRAIYERAGGSELVDWPFHLALAHFKIAVIAAGIDHRRRAGSGEGAGFETAGEAVRPFLEAGLSAMRG
jgi:aminoglycoside phosphotransferase (APT) family kinase protein